jgi:hypothetical protein
MGGVPLAAANMILTPGAVQAGQQATISPAVASVVNGGERFMDAAPLAMGNALLLRATFIEHGLAGLNEQAVGTKQGAGWLPGRWGRGIY